jgi:ATP-dependent RNA helicase RhlE
MPEPIEEHAAVKQYNDPISVAKRAKQKLYHVSQADKNAMLEQIIRSLSKAKAVVITKTKRGADTLESYLQTRDINAIAVHSNKGKQACEAGAKAFSEGEIDILITTDMILQALDLTGIEHMLGYDLPLEPEHYLSRMGCMSETGEGISLVSEEEETLLFLIERKMRQEIMQEELDGFIPTPESEQMSKSLRTHKKKPRHKKTKSKLKDVSKEQKA